jgi:hypothetical protein
MNNFPIKYSITSNNVSFYTDNNFIVSTIDGFANLSFDPTCSGEYSGAPKFQVGEQQWKAEVNDSELNCYYNNVTSDYLYRNLTVWGDISLTLDKPDGTENYTSGEGVLFQGFVENDCGESLTVDVNNIWFNLTNDYWNFLDSCTDVSQLGSNVYKCTWDSTNSPSGWYNVSITSNQAYHYENSTYRYQPDTFYLSTPPVLEDYGVTPSADGWTTMFNFTVNVSDVTNDTVQIHLWEKIGAGAWAEISPTDYNCTDCNKTQFYWNRTYSCPAEIGTVQFKFNATDIFGTKTETVVESFTVEPEDVSIFNITPEPDSIINRSGTTVFTIEIYDTDNNTYPVGRSGKIWITTDATFTYDDGTSDGPINETGHLNRTMTQIQWGCAGQYVLGTHKWKGDTDDTCYKSNVTDEIYFTLIGDLRPNLVTPDGTRNYTKGDDITVNTTIRTDCGNLFSGADTIYYNFTHVESGTIFRCPTSGNANDKGGGYYDYNCPTNNMPLGWYDVSIYVNENNYNDNYTTTSSIFFLGRNPEFYNPSVSPNIGGWSESPFNFTIKISGSNNDTSNVTFLLKNFTSNQWFEVDWDSCDNCSNYLMNFTYNFTRYNIDIWRFRFIVNDSSGFSNDTESVFGSIMNFTVERDDISIFLGEGDGITINRSDSRPNHETMFSVRIFDRDNNTYTTNISNDNFYLWVSLNSTHWQELNEEKNSTHYYKLFNASCSYELGIRYWNMSSFNDPYWKDNSSQNFQITLYADLNNYILQPDGSTNYTQGNSIEIIGNITDDCDNAVTGATINYVLITESGTSNCNKTNNDGWSEGNGWYNCSWDSTDESPGWYNITMQSNKTYYNDDQYTREKVFFLKAPVELSSPNVNPNPGGWGSSFNFTVTVNHYNDVDVCLLERIPPASSFSITQCRRISIPTNLVVNFTRSYTCSEVGKTLFYYFNASEPNGDAYSESNTTSIGHTHDIQKDNILISYKYGNESIVNRNGSYVADLILFVNDTDKGSHLSNPNITVTFNVTWNGTQFRTDGSIETNNTGYANYEFDPVCSPYTRAGKQKWLGYSDGDTCYNSDSSNQFNVSVIGDMYLNITSPDGDDYMTTSVIDILGKIQDECLIENISSAFFNFTIISEATSDRYECNVTTNLGNGIYNCSWNSTGAPLGWYDVEFNATNVSYYNNATRIISHVFRITPYEYSPCILQNETVVPEDDGGWGEEFTFKVNVTDIDGQDVNVSFWLSPDNQTWTNINSSVCEHCGVLTELSFTYNNFNCSDIPDYYYKFNATDPNNITDRPSFNFTLDKDDILIEFITSNNTYVNRSEYVQLLVRINDTDNNSLVFPETQGKFWITYDKSNFDSGWTNNTDDDSYLIYSFSPNCIYSVGWQYWIAGTHENSCYINTNSTTNNILNITGWLNNTIIEPSGEYYNQSQNVTMVSNITDECGNLITDAFTSFIVNHDSFEDYCTDVISGSGLYNCTWNVTNSPGGYYNLTMNSERGLYNIDNETKTNAFFVEVSPILNDEYVTPEEKYWGTTFDFYVNITDDDDNVNVTLWHKKQPSTDWIYVSSQTISDPINETLNFQNTYWQGDIGIWDWKFNVTDSYNQIDETSVHTLNVTKRHVKFVYIVGNNTNVSRIGENRTILTLQVKDNVSDSNILSGSGNFWVTVNGSDYGPSIPLSITGQGYLNLSFNGTCTYDVGQQLWKAGLNEQNYYFASNSTELLRLYIYSLFLSNVTYPNGIPYTEGTLINITGEVRDECGLVPDANIQFRIEKSGNSYIPNDDPAIDWNNGTYTTSWNSVGFFLGWYNISMNSTKSYYNSSNITGIDKFILGRAPQIEDPYVDPQQEGWGYNFTFNATFRDTDTEYPADVVNVSLWKAYSPTGPWYYIYSENQSSTTSIEVKYYNVFDCSDYFADPSHQVYYKFRAEDGLGFVNETSSQILTLEQDDISLIELSAPASIDREDFTTGKFLLRIRDTDYGDWVGNNLNGTFGFTYDQISYINFDNQTNSTGHIWNDFDPNCTYDVGLQYWRLNMQGNSCYKDNSTTPAGFIVTGQLKNNLTEPEWIGGVQPIYNVTQQIPINFSIHTDCSNDGLINDASTTDITLIHNGDEYVCNPDNQGNGYYNCTWDSTNKPEGNYSIRLESTRTDYNGNTTTYVDWFWLENLNTTSENGTANPNVGGWTRIYNYSIDIYDEEGDTLNCTLFISRDNQST